MNSSNIQEPWSKDIETVASVLASSISSGLSTEEAKQRMQQFGSNKIESKNKRGWLNVLSSQLKSLLVLLLVIAAILAFSLHNWVEGIAICIVILINTAIGFFTEWSALRSMNSLRQFNTTKATVKRNNTIISIIAEELVPGDVVVINAGNIISADMRLISSSQLQSNESLLTGEAFPIDKRPTPLPNDTILSERSNMLYKGSSITRGTAEAIVTATGLQTELGNISSLLHETEDEITPLEKHLSLLGRKLIIITLLIALFTLGIGLLSGKELYLMIETSIALAVAAIPEGLPIIATLALARGMWRMAKNNAIINKLSAVETLGATNVICTDKTGTLTENKMTLVRIVTDSCDYSLDTKKTPNESVKELIRIGTFCNKAILSKSSDGEKSMGDPLEIALLQTARQLDIFQADLLNHFPMVYEQAFDSESKMMGTVHQQNNHFLVAVKGAAEPLLSAADTILTENGISKLDEFTRQKWLDKNHKLASSGYRVLAFAKKTTDQKEHTLYSHLTFLGLSCFVDPPRPDIKKTLSECRNAGIRVIMITGDQPGTATHIAKTVGIISENDTSKVVQGKNMPLLLEKGHESLRDTSIFARVTPKDKLDIIQSHQTNSSIVAMTGDGVNDAPALKKADIGIAMGIRGTEVAREASDMILRDDAFSTIVDAIKQGRIIFNNIRKFVIYLMSCNLSEVLIVALAAGVNAPLPLLPLQILFLNIVTDVFPALALGASEGDAKVLSSPPRNIKDQIIGTREWVRICLFSSIISATVLISFGLAIFVFEFSTTESVTVSFLILALSQIFHVFNITEHSSPIFNNEITRNRFVWLAIGICLALLATAIYIPIFADILSIKPPSIKAWFLIITASFIPFIFGRLYSYMQKFRHQNDSASRTIFA